MICKDSNEELEFLKDTFIANDFPINIVDRIFKNYIPHKYRTDGRENTQKTPIDFEKSFKVLYVKGFSDIERRELQKEAIHVIFSKLEKKLCKLTPKKPIEESKHNIYRKYCSKCSATYIGESGMTMKQRDTLHTYFKSDIKTGKSRRALYTHISDHKDPEIDWEKIVILDKEIHFEKRKIKEAIYTNTFDHAGQSAFRL